MIMTPQLAVPFAFNSNGEANINEQGSPADLRARAYNVCVCPVGFREDNPDFGIPGLLFKGTPLKTAPIRQAVETWAELDASVLDEAAALDAATRNVTVEVG